MSAKSIGVARTCACSLTEQPTCSGHNSLWLLRIRRFGLLRLLISVAFDDTFPTHHESRNSVSMHDNSVHKASFGLASQWRSGFSLRKASIFRRQPVMLPIGTSSFFRSLTVPRAWRWSGTGSEKFWRNRREWVVTPGRKVESIAVWASMFTNQTEPSRLWIARNFLPACTNAGRSRPFTGSALRKSKRSNSITVFVTVS